jgi:uncharacterized RDD family membrane protein YckC
MSIEGTVRYAGFWIRLAAYILDAIFIAIIGSIICYILAIVMVLVIGGVDPSLSYDNIGTLAGFVTGIIFYIGFWSWRGQTPGKMIVGIKIVRNDGSSINIGRAFLRLLGYVVSGLIIYVGYLMIAWDVKKQGLHDKIADTIVIKVR